MSTIAVIERFPIARKGLIMLLNENIDDSDFIGSSSAAAFIEQFPNKKIDLLLSQWSPCI
jgi:DNA-binding NarL/FixJ family response regulator